MLNSKYIILLVLAVLIQSQVSFSQLCQGNLGENIFVRGDFGSGVNPVVTTNPNIAPGYNFITNIPNDGQYAITNNTAHWNLYPTWLSIRDNSSDPNGY